MFIKLLLLFFILDHSYSNQICKIPNGNAGRCVPLTDCDPLHELYNNKSRTPEEDTFIRQSVASCGSYMSKITVCCLPQSQWSSLVMRPVTFPKALVAFAHSSEVLATADDAVENITTDLSSPPVTEHTQAEFSGDSPKAA